MPKEIAIIPDPQRTIIFIDGMNLYHSIDNNEFLHECKWLDLLKLCGIFVDRIPPENIYYFTAVVTWNTAKAGKHQKLIDIYEDMGINIIKGYFAKSFKECRATCKEEYSFNVEKTTDVNIGVNVVCKAFLNEYDTGLVMSGDNDLLPALKTVKNHFKDKNLGVIVPYGITNTNNLQQNSDLFWQIKYKQLLNCVLPNPYKTRDGVYKNCPTNWVKTV